MLNLHSKKSKRIMSGVIVVMLVLAMLVSILAYM